MNLHWFFQICRCMLPFSIWRKPTMDDIQDIYLFNMNSYTRYTIQWKKEIIIIQIIQMAATRKSTKYGALESHTASNHLPWSLSAPWTAMLTSFFPTLVAGFPAVLMMTEKLSFCFSAFQFYCFGLFLFCYMTALCWTTARSSSLSSIFYFYFFSYPRFYEGLKKIIITRNTFCGTRVSVPLLQK